MDELPISVLVVASAEANREVQSLLRQAPETRFDLEWVGSMDEALPCLGIPCYDVCVVVHEDGTDTVGSLEAARAAGCGGPMLILADRDDPDLRAAVERLGPADLVSREGLEAHVLECVLRHALRNAELSETLRQAIRENAQFAAGLAALPGGAILTDPDLPDNPVVFVNPGFERLTGYRADEVIGRNCRFLQGPDTDQGAVADIRDAVAALRPITRVILNYRKDGTPFWNELRLSPVFDAEGALVNFVGLQRDVTAEREARTRLESTEQCLLELVTRLEEPAAVHRDGRLVHANSALARLLGIEDAADLEGRLIQELVLPEDRAALAGGHDVALEHGCGSCHRTVRFRRADGTAVTAEIQCTPVSYQGAPAVLDRVIAGPARDEARFDA